MHVPELPEVPALIVQTSPDPVFNQVSLATMAKSQNKDSALKLVILYVHKGSNQRA